MRLTLVTLALAIVSASAVARAGPSDHVRGGRIAGGARFMRVGRSLGSPTEGHLIGGAHLDDAPYLRIVPTYAGGDVRWGLEPLVSMLDRAAREVRRQFPEAVMSVGHLSQPGGGEIDRHASHESGRDADVAFYMRTQTEKPLYNDHFVPFRGDGTAPSWPGAFFDDARNWALVAAFAGENRARVTYIFVAAPLRARLLAYAARIGAPLPLRSRAAELMEQPRGSLPHDDHFHVRIGCPPGMAGCIELPTAHARRRGHSSLARNHAAHTPAVAHESRPAARDLLPDSHPIEPPALPGTPADPPALLGEPIDDVDGLVTP